CALCDVPILSSRYFSSIIHYSLIGSHINYALSAGIPFNGKSVYCPCDTCDFLFCAACQGQHEIFHYPLLLRFDLIQWQPRMINIESEADCIHCNKSVKARVQCADCSMGFCFECWSSPNRKLILGKHLEEKKGRKWTIVFPPGWSVEKGVSE